MCSAAKQNLINKRFKIFQLKKLVYIQLLLVSFVSFFTSVLHFPGFVAYVSDIIMIILACMVFLRKRGKMSIHRLKAIDWVALLFLTYCLCSSIISGSGFVITLWSVRMTFRFFIFYYCCISILDEIDIRKIYYLFDVLFFVNVIFVVIEYCFFDIKGDYLGGIFGIEKGCNGSLVVFISIIMAYETVKYLNQSTKISIYLLYVFFSMLIAAFAELKVLYFIVPLIVLLGIIFAKPTLRTAILIVSGVAMFCLGFLILSQVRPDSFDLIFNSTDLVYYLNADYSGGREIGRTNSISFVNELFFDNPNLTSTLHLGFGNFQLNQLFGFGFGSTESSAYFSSTFSEIYSYTNYSWYECAVRYIETGWFGIILYLLFFLFIFFQCFKKNINLHNRYIDTVKIFVPIILILFIYQSLRNDASYYIFFVLASARIVSNFVNDPSVQVAKGF